jgi:transcriptional regulator with XRE-family HTH domain
MSSVQTDKQVLENIAINLSRLLKKKGWSQADLSRASGENEMRVSSAVRGTNMPSGAALHRFAEVLGVKADEIMDPPPKKIANGVYTP